MSLVYLLHRCHAARLRCSRDSDGWAEATPNCSATVTSSTGSSTSPHRSQQPPHAQATVVPDHQLLQQLRIGPRDKRRHHHHCPRGMPPKLERAAKSPPSTRPSSPTPYPQLRLQRCRILPHRRPGSSTGAMRPTWTEVQRQSHGQRPQLSILKRASPLVELVGRVGVEPTT